MIIPLDIEAVDCWAALRPTTLPDESVPVNGSGEDDIWALRTDAASDTATRHFVVRLRFPDGAETSGRTRPYR